MGQDLDHPRPPGNKGSRILPQVFREAQTCLRLLKAGKRTKQLQDFCLRLLHHLGQSLLRAEGVSQKQSQQQTPAGPLLFCVHEYSVYTFDFKPFKENYVKTLAKHKRKEGANAHTQVIVFAEGLRKQFLFLFLNRTITSLRQSKQMNKAQRKQTSQ